MKFCFTYIACCIINRTIGFFSTSNCEAINWFFLYEKEKKGERDEERKRERKKKRKRNKRKEGEKEKGKEGEVGGNKESENQSKERKRKIRNISQNLVVKASCQRAKKTEPR